MSNVENEVRFEDLGDLEGFDVGQPVTQEDLDRQLAQVEAAGQVRTPGVDDMLDELSNSANGAGALDPASINIHRNGEKDEDGRVRIILSPGQYIEGELPAHPDGAEAHYYVAMPSNRLLDVEDQNISADPELANLTIEHRRWAEHREAEAAQVPATKPLPEATADAIALEEYTEENLHKSQTEFDAESAANPGRAEFLRNGTAEILHAHEHEVEKARAFAEHSQAAASFSEADIVVPSTSEDLEAQLRSLADDAGASAALSSEEAEGSTPTLQAPGMSSPRPAPSATHGSHVPLIGEPHPGPALASAAAQGRAFPVPAANPTMPKMPMGAAAAAAMEGGQPSAQRVTMQAPGVLSKIAGGIGVAAMSTASGITNLVREGVAGWKASSFERHDKALNASIDSFEQNIAKLNGADSADVAAEASKAIQRDIVQIRSGVSEAAESAANIGSDAKRAEAVEKLAGKVERVKHASDQLGDGSQHLQDAEELAKYIEEIAESIRQVLERLRAFFSQKLAGLMSFQGPQAAGPAAAPRAPAASGPAMSMG